MPEDTINIDQIDFLPPSYRVQRRRRATFAWQGALAGLLLLIASGTAWNQHHHLSELRDDLAGLRRQHDGANSQANHLTEIQAELATETIEAELYTYLRHPWPRSQLINSVLKVLPEGISLTRLEITKEMSGSSSRFKQRKQRNNKEPVLVGAAADLKSLRKATSQGPDRIEIHGWTEDDAQTHHFLTQVSLEPLIQSAELISFQRQARGGLDGVSFEALLTIKPGYGQPKGPEKPYLPNGDRIHNTAGTRVKKPLGLNQEVLAPHNDGV